MSFVLIAAGVFYYLVTLNHPYIGVNMKSVNGHWIISGIDPRGDGYEAGVRTGDIVLKINEKEPEEFPNLLKWQQIEGASLIEVTKQNRRVSITLPIKTNIVRNLTEIPLQILGFVFWLLGFMAWVKRPFLVQARALFWLNWIIGMAIVLVPASARCIFFARELELICLSIVPIFLINLVWVYPKDSRTRTYNLIRNIFIIISLIIISYIILQSCGIFNNVRLLRSIFTSNLIIALILALGNLGLSLKLPIENKVRNQAGILFIGMVLGFFPFVFLTVLPQLFNVQPIKYSDFSSLFLAFVPTAWYYVIVNKYLPDSRRIFEAIVVSFIQSIILSMVTSYLLYSQKIIKAINIEVFLLTLSFSILVIVIINFTRMITSKLLSRLAFSEGKQTFKQRMLKLNENLVSINEEKGIFEEILKSLGIQGAYIIIENPKRGYLTKAVGTFLENPDQLAELEMYFQSCNKTNLKATILSENLPAEIFIPVNSGDFSCGIFLGHRHSHIKFKADELPLITLISSQLTQRLITTFVIKELSVEIKSLAQRSQDSLRRNQGLQGITIALFRNLERERAHVASEIYDGPLQLGLDLNRWLKHLGEECPMDDKTENAVSHMRELVENLNFELRQISNDLRPTALKDLGLLTAVELLCKDIMLKELSLITLETIGLNREDRFPEEIESAAYRFIQEGITNAVKHSGANKLTIGIEKTEANLELTVKDRGKGFETNKIEEWALIGSHFGIVSMKERVESLGGSLQITSQIHRGTILKATVPII
ncbi:ATP-binding protein [Desulfosporosinus orientis]|uniref:ATP-binding protein n=1 Tax=Desulfosporosinus orientis TaxID=1563 RepID=UPI000304622B|nr:ATP-binding protein [Desulfosporosinus orientis]